MQSTNVLFPDLRSEDNINSATATTSSNFIEPPRFFHDSLPTISRSSAHEDRCVEDLRSVEEIPPPYRSVFQNYAFFNVIQSRILDDVLYSDESVVVSAPTGSGKTVIFEMAILRLLMNRQDSFQVFPYKMVYVAPMKALCEERLTDWYSKFASLGLTCISVTGDSDNLDFQNLLSHNLIITTPEKWDSLTRRWKENKKLVALVKLFMIDEVHHLSEENRGPTLEAVVSRMKTIQDLLTPEDSSEDPALFQNIRFVAVSATIPNAEDVAEWLSMPAAPAKAFKFGDDMRPVKLKKVVLGYHYNPQASTPFKFDIMLNYKLESIMLQHAEGKPTLIFCSTRKNVEMTAKHITQNITINLNPQQRQILNSALLAITESKVREMLLRGVCYHHAGLSLEDRKVIETLFRKANLPILVTTSTLAMGVNLPAHLVVIKSTKHYSNGEYRDYSECMLLQMIGRAGRPQFDTSATAVILTTASDKQKYESMVGGEQPVESNLHKHLAEHLNSEVVLRTITDLGVAMQWLTSTFLHIRARKNPRHYGLPLGLSPDQIDKKLLDMCQIEINKLARGGMLTIDQNNIIITPTDVGLLMAKYYVAFDTMTLFTQVTGKEILQQVLALISKCHEFSEIYLRVNDKKTLNILNKCRNRETIRFPFTGTIKTVDMKINCIIQAVFGCLQILEQSLVTESQKIMRIGERISNCFAKYLETKGNCYSALLNALILAKCFHARLWENSPFVSKQLTGIGSALSSSLVAAGKTSFKVILDTNPREIERIINRRAPMGNTIQEQIEHLPDYVLILEEIMGEEKFSVNLKIYLRNAKVLQVQSSVDVNSIMYLLVGDTNNNMYLYEKYRHNYMMQHSEINKTFDFPLSYDQEIKVHFISEDWVGIDCEASLLPSVIKKNIDSGNKQLHTKNYGKSTSKSKVSSQNPSKSENKSEMPRKPSHIQTLVDTFFKKIKPVDGKTQKRKEETTLSKHQDGDKENINPSENQKQNNHMQKQNSLTQNCDKSDSEAVLPQTQSQITLQKLIDDSLKECEKIRRRQSRNEPELMRENQHGRGYYLPQEVIQNFSFNDTSNSAVVVHSNGYSATVRRVPESNKGLDESNSFKELNNSNGSSKYNDKNRTDFKPISRIPHLTPPGKKKQFLFKENMNCTVNFESSIQDRSSDEENNLDKSISLMFKYTPHKKLNREGASRKTDDHLDLNKSDWMNQNHACDGNPTTSTGLTGCPNTILDIKIEAPNTPKANEALPKTIKWRSPLVTSPTIKYSPIFCSEATQLERTLNLSSSSWNNTPPVRENKTNEAFSTNMNDAPELSGLSLIPSSQTSSVLKPLQLFRPTLKENVRKSGASIPLSDRDYLESLNQNESSNTENSKNSGSAEDELVSVSLMESLGLVVQGSEQAQNQNSHIINNTEARKDSRPGHFPSISEYYQQCESEFKRREGQYRPKRATINSSQVKNDVNKNINASLEVRKPVQNSQHGINSNFSFLHEQPSTSKNVCDEEFVFDLSLNDSVRDTSQLINFELKNSILNRSLIQPAASTTNFDQNESHPEFNVPASSSNCRSSMFPQKFGNLNEFKNKEKFSEHPLSKNANFLNSSQQHKQCFSQNLNVPTVNCPGTSRSFNRYSSVSQPSNQSSSQVFMDNPGSYCSVTVPEVTHSIERKRKRTCNTNCQCFKCAQNCAEVEKPPFPNFNFYSQPIISRRCSHQDHVDSGYCSNRSRPCCCAGMSCVEPDRFRKPPPLCYSPPRNVWDAPSNNLYNFEQLFHANQKRQKLENIHHTPFTSKRFSYYDCGSQVSHSMHDTGNVRSLKHRPCSFHENDLYENYNFPPRHHCNDESIYFMGVEKKQPPTYNENDKQFLIQRYLHSVQQDQVHQHDEVNSHVPLQCITQAPQELDVSAGDTEGISDDDEFDTVFTNQ